VSEFGVFNDEGLIDPGFRTLAAAEAAARQWRDDGEEWAKAAEVCPRPRGAAARHLRRVLG
jgi:hypothetical protein